MTRQHLPSAMPGATTIDAIDAFITRWQSSGAAERSNYALFLSELCDLLGVPRPDPSSDQSELNDYVIDRAFTRIDKDGNRTTVPHKAFEELLTHAAASPAGFSTLITALWKDMASGSDYSAAIRAKVLHFNGGLFENPSALPLKADQIQLLVEAARQDWKEVEPAIFGTLLERALNPRERHKLGAHYTPRSYVERTTARIRTITEILDTLTALGKL